MVDSGGNFLKIIRLVNQEDMLSTTKKNKKQKAWHLLSSIKELQYCCSEYQVWQCEQEENGESTMN